MQSITRLQASVSRAGSSHEPSHRNDRQHERAASERDGGPSPHFPPRVWSFVMTARCMEVSGESNPGGENNFTISRNGDEWIAAVMRAVHSVFPRKTADILAHLTGRDPRTAKNWRSENRGMKAADLIALLRDNAAGPAVRDAILAGAEWHETERAMLDLVEAQQKFEAARADVQRRQAAQRLKHPRK